MDDDFDFETADDSFDDDLGSNVELEGLDDLDDDD
jgi:hypothetical protein